MSATKHFRSKGKENIPAKSRKSVERTLNGLVRFGCVECIFFLSGKCYHFCAISRRKTNIRVSQTMYHEYIVNRIKMMSVCTF